MRCGWWVVGLVAWWTVGVARADDPGSSCRREGGFEIAGVGLAACKPLPIHGIATVGVRTPSGLVDYWTKPASDALAARDAWWHIELSLRYADPAKIYAESRSGALWTQLYRGRDSDEMVVVGVQRGANGQPPFLRFWRVYGAHDSPIFDRFKVTIPTSEFLSAGETVGAGGLVATAGAGIDGTYSILLPPGATMARSQAYQGGDQLRYSHPSWAGHLDVVYREGAPATAAHADAARDALVAEAVARAGLPGLERVSSAKTPTLLRERWRHATTELIVIAGFHDRSSGIVPWAWTAQCADADLAVGQCAQIVDSLTVTSASVEPAKARPAGAP